MGKRVAVTVIRNGSETYYDPSISVGTKNRPVVHLIDLDRAAAMQALATSGGTAFKYFTEGAAFPQILYVAESLSALSALNDASTSTNLFATDVKTDVAGAGGNQGAATALTRYFNKVSSATASSAEGVALPTATVNKVVVIQNATTATVKVYPKASSGATINGGSANASVDLAAGALTIYWSDGTNWFSLYTQ